MKILRQAEALFLKEMPVIPIYWYTRKILIRPEVRNWQANVLDRPFYKHVYLESKN